MVAKIGLARGPVAATAPALLGLCAFNAEIAELRQKVAAALLLRLIAQFT